MTAEQLKGLSKEKVFQFIRDRLSFKDITSHLRYVDKNEFKKNISGSKCRHVSTYHVVHKMNTEIINAFTDLGLYNYTSYLSLDFYKGSPTLYLRYLDEDEDREIDDLDGYGTTEIIYKIFELTIFSGKRQRQELKGDCFHKKHEGSAGLFEKDMGFHPN